MSSIAVVVPTYNESANIAAMIRAILALGDEYHVIIVDDGSPDGTGEIADELAAANDSVEVIHRSGKGGRGSACIAGFRSALARPKFDLFIEMDADFSHDPADLPRLVGLMSSCDVAIGSRYLRESKIVNWGAQRHVFSHFANAYARLLLGIPISDYTNGYRCYTRRALESIDLDSIESRGYIVLSEMAYLLHKQGMRFGEIPILFVNRRRGKSNTSLREIAEAFTSVIQIRAQHGSRAASPQS